ncbi:Spermidine/putrescine-binding periplasmic protein [Leuconostoc carnosum]|uniref:ABC transporter substrate-binding protein n=1 Tax=Leuconostoc carnosum TaxID=1252 RepID=UPI000D50FD79|nr:ABC transporter substrate-binding protein [Leuconostoc carnosum]KAA8326411.1 ABC transporter substrate-binding protein [Leuconostoc carnosum]SPO34139.1 Spermidine/putrescine-binding periplasmic protein [Leuconostoc carnosum]
MKKILVSVLSLFVLLMMLFGLKNYFSTQTGSGVSSGKVLNLYNWGDYIDPALLKKFTRETGYKVSYETFDSNEAMYTKIKQGGTSYDLTIPSEYMLEKMKKENLLLPLDHSRLTGLKNYDDRFLNQIFDRGNKYSLPYFWGTLGILYNDKFVNAKDIKHWDDLWSTKFRNKIMLIDSARDVLGFTLMTQNKSVNTRSAADLAAAQGKLTTLMPNVKAIVADEIKMYMAQEEAAIAITYSGEAAEAMSNNSHLHYLVPSEGSNLWFDNIVMPRTAKHKDAAYAFLNFMNDPKNAAQNAEYIGYATPNKKAFQMLPKAIRTDQQFYLNAKVVERLQVYDDLGRKWTEKYNDAFLEFKMTQR